MKKSVKKIISVIAVFALVLSLAACGGKSFKCGICNEEKKGKSYKSQLMGQEITICEDCHKELGELAGK